MTHGQFMTGNKEIAATGCNPQRDMCMLDWCPQTDPKALSFNLNVAIHEHHLESPTLKPTESEGIRHQVNPSTARSPYGAGRIVQGLSVSKCIQTASEVGFLALQTRVMK